MFNFALELKVNKQKKKHLSLTVPETFGFSQNSSAPFHRVTFDHSTSCALLIDKPNIMGLFWKEQQKDLQSSQNDQ